LLQSPPQKGHMQRTAAATSQGPSVEEFSRMTTEFAERYRMPDGSVYPRRMKIRPVQRLTPTRGTTCQPQRPLTMPYPPNLTPILGMVERLQWLRLLPQTRTQAMGTVPCRVARGKPLMC
jgi:hypothetical protein